MHYYIRRDTVMEKVKKMIAEDAYFVVHAQRQMGKTTLLENMMFELEAESENFIGILADFEIYRRTTLEHFYESFREKFETQLLKRYKNTQPEKVDILRENLSILPVDSPISFERYIRLLTEMIGEYRLAVVIDEFEGCPSEAMEDFLYVLRSFYLSKKRNENLRNLSFILVGIRDLTQLTVGTISPFNIAQQLTLNNFTQAEVQKLFGEYTAETGQPFSDEVIESIYSKTQGQPFLVNRFGVILTEELSLDKTQPIGYIHFQQAYKRLIQEDNNNFKTIKRHAKKYRDELLKIIAGVKIAYNPHLCTQQEMFNFGLVKRTNDDVLEIANHIYETILGQSFAPTR